MEGDDNFDSSKSPQLASIESRTLGEIWELTSFGNLYAELIYAPSKRFAESVPGDISAASVRVDGLGCRAVIKTMASGSYVATKKSKFTSSGLSRLDFVPPESFGKARFTRAKPFAQVSPNPCGCRDGRTSAASGKVKKIAGENRLDTFVNSLAVTRLTRAASFRFVRITNTHAPNGSRLIDRGDNDSVTGTVKK